MRIFTLALTAALFVSVPAFARTVPVQCTDELYDLQQARRIVGESRRTLTQATEWQRIMSRRLNIDYPRELQVQENLIFRVDQERVRALSRLEAVNVRFAYIEELEDKRCHGFPGTLRNWTRECNRIEAEANRLGTARHAAERIYALAQRNFDRYIGVIQNRINYINRLNDLRVSGETNAYNESMSVAKELVSFSRDSYRSAAQAEKAASTKYNECISRKPKK